MQLLANIMTPGTAINPFVINMSLGGGNYVSQCTYANPAFATAVQTLFDRGVPVVAATGNNGYTNAINWPACVPRVIKVSAVNNDSFGNTRSFQANLPILSFFPDEFLWLAPGGGDFTNVRSSDASATSTTQTGEFQGTSMAAPHIAGFYAVLKAVVPGIAINDISNWIQANASVPVTFNFCSTGPPCPTTYRRPRLQWLLMFHRL